MANVSWPIFYLSCGKAQSKCSQLNSIQLGSESLYSYLYLSGLNGRNGWLTCLNVMKES
jgi:hypothetical protein